jgi:putative membrane protein
VGRVQKEGNEPLPPPGRVQAIEISEPLLWRSRGWVRVSLNVAGLASGQEDGQVSQVLLPVAPKEVASRIIHRVLPGVDLSGLRLQPAPDRARKRAWLQWSNLAVAVDERVLVTSRGFLTRQLAVIPHARTQSVGVTQGPWQRALGLASVRVDTTPGPVVVVGLHRDAIEARAIAEDQLIRAARARAAGPAERWMTSRGPAGQPAPPSATPRPGHPAGAGPGAAGAQMPGTTPSGAGHPPPQGRVAPPPSGVDDSPAGGPGGPGSEPPSPTTPA